MNCRRIFSIGMLAVAMPLSIQAGKLFDKTARKQLTAMLNENCQWLLAVNQGKESARESKEVTAAMVIESCTARALLAASELNKEGDTYLTEALRWCDSFATSQRVVPSSKGNEAGYWLETGNAGSLDLASQSAAAFVLARACVSTEGPRRKGYLQALDRYARFLVEGCKDDPESKGRGGIAGWVILEGENKGAFGTGYAKDRILRQVSTQATAATSAFLAELYGLSRNAQHRELAAGAVRWILKAQRAFGDISNLVDGKESEEAPMQTLMICSDTMLGCFYLLQDDALNQQLLKEAEPVARWLVRSQTEKGLWGEGADQRGSTAAVAFLAWFHVNSKQKDEVFSQTLDKAWQVFSNPVHAQSFGVQLSKYNTALLGLATAEMIKPGITYKKF